MCGIVGVLTKNPTATTRNIFKTMHFLDRLRGDHGSGIIGVDRGLKTTWYKKAVPTPDFYNYPVASRIVEEPNNILLVGHNRAATMGKINDDNAHPFERGDLVGVHNGTLTSRFNLKDYQTIDVDSDNIYHHMSAHGVKDTIRELRGAFTLVWVDIKNNTLHMIRNNERPLSLISSKDGNSLFFASEPWMIQVAAKREKVELGEVQDLKVGALISIDLTLFPQKESVKVEQLELYEAPSQVKPLNSSEKWRGSYQTSQTSGTYGDDASSIPLPFSHGGRIRLRFDRLERSYMRNTNEYLHYVHGFSVSGRQVSIIVSSDMYEVLRTRASSIESVSAGFSHYYIQGTRTLKPRITYVANGTEKVSATFKDGSISNYDASRPSYPDTFEDDVPFNDDPDNLLEFKVRGYNDTLITAKRFSEITNCGCATCADPVELKDANDIEWLSHEAFLCKHCSDLKKEGGLTI